MTGAGSLRSDGQEHCVSGKACEGQQVYNCTGNSLNVRD